ncbi:prohibitin-like protein [Cricetulus griseus]|nr:prohibitin-like protein [Cricetulus griseus]
MEKDVLSVGYCLYTCMYTTLTVDLVSIPKGAWNIKNSLLHLSEGQTEDLEISNDNELSGKGIPLSREKRLGRAFELQKSLRIRKKQVITGSKDLQNVNITLHILLRPVANQLPRIYTSIGEDCDERVLPSVTTEILKSVMARFDAGELITQQEMVSRQESEVEDVYKETVFQTQ